MKSADQNVSGNPAVSCLLLLLLFLGVSLPARGELGGDISTVSADQSRFKANLRIMRAPAYSVHEIVSPDGIAVREYASPQGKIFAVAWNGPHVPDLRQLLGQYFQQFSQAAQRRVARRAAIAIAEPGLVVQSGGHMRSFFGRAYLPDALPTDVRPEEIR
jgi:hypothetical protein